VRDPESDEHVAEGEDGELVFTTLTKEALPMLRYRSGDIGAVTLEPCVCGRTTARLKHLRGRRDDMVIVRGVNLYPSNVEHILLRVEELSPHYQLVVERNGHMDELTVQVEPATGGVDRAALVERVEHFLREQTGIRIAVDLLAVGGVPRFEGKAVRVVDRR
jgi:phenylacetate-CoA ligase